MALNFLTRTLNQVVQDLNHGVQAAASQNPALSGITHAVADVGGTIGLGHIGTSQNLVTDVLNAPAAVLSGNGLDAAANLLDDTNAVGHSALDLVSTVVSTTTDGGGLLSDTGLLAPVSQAANTLVGNLNAGLASLGSAVPALQAPVEALTHLEDTIGLGHLGTSGNLVTDLTTLPGEVISGSGIAALEPVAQDVGAVVGATGSLVGSLAGSLTDTANGLVPAVVDSAGHLLDGASASLGDAVGDLLTGVGDAVANTTGAVIDVAHTLTDPGTGLIPTVVDSAANVLDAASSALGNAVDGIGSSLADAVSNTTGALAGVTDALTHAETGLVPGLVDTATDVLQGANTSLGGTVGGLVSGLGDAVGGLTGALAGATGSTGDGVIGGSLLSDLGNALGSLAGLGSTPGDGGASDMHPLISLNIGPSTATPIATVDLASPDTGIVVLPAVTGGSADAGHAISINALPVGNDVPSLLNTTLLSGDSIAFPDLGGTGADSLIGKVLDVLTPSAATPTPSAPDLHLDLGLGLGASLDLGHLLDPGHTDPAQAATSHHLLGL